MAAFRYRGGLAGLRGGGAGAAVPAAVLRQGSVDTVTVSHAVRDSGGCFHNQNRSLALGRGADLTGRLFVPNQALEACRPVAVAKVTGQGVGLRWPSMALRGCDLKIFSGISPRPAVLTCPIAERCSSAQLRGAIGVGGTGWLIQGEVFPTSVRGRAANHAGPDGLGALNLGRRVLCMRSPPREGLS